MIREVKESDCADIAKIYNGYVAGSTATFEITAVSENEMRHRIADISSEYPYFVSELDGAVAGYCYAHRWKEREAYSKTLETTVYVSSEYIGKGVGKKLMERLIEECRKRGFKALIACITAENENSRTFHLRLGFKQVSMFENVGMKFGRELDVTDYELLLP